MDYAPLAEWTGDLVVSPFNTDDVDRALAGYATWGEVPDLYPPDFPAVMNALRERLTTQPTATVGVTARAVPDEIALIVRAPDIANSS